MAPLNLVNLHKGMLSDFKAGGKLLIRPVQWQNQFFFPGIIIQVTAQDTGGIYFVKTMIDNDDK